MLQFRWSWVYPWSHRVNGHVPIAAHPGFGEASKGDKGRPSHPRFRRRRRQLSIYRNHTADCKRQIYSAGFVFWHWRSAEHTSELQSLMRHSYAVSCLEKKHLKQHADKHIRHAV